MRWLTRLRSWWLGWREDVAYAEQQDFYLAEMARRAQAWGDIPNTLPLTSVPNVERVVLARRQADQAGQASPGATEGVSPPIGDHPSRKWGAFASGKGDVHPMRGMNDD